MCIAFGCLNRNLFTCLCEKSVATHCCFQFRTRCSNYQDILNSTQPVKHWSSLIQLQSNTSNHIVHAMVSGEHITPFQKWTVMTYDVFNWCHQYEIKTTILSAGWYTMSIEKVNPVLGAANQSQLVNDCLEESLFPFCLFVCFALTQVLTYSSDCLYTHYPPAPHLLSAGVMGVNDHARFI